MPAIVVRTLRHEYRLIAPSAAVAGSLGFMTIAPEIAGAALEPVDLPVEYTAGFLRLRMPDGSLAEGTAAHVITRLHGLILTDVIDGEPGVPLIHGATLVGGGRRFLLVGTKGGGKSTLALYLLAQGFAVEGDEHLVIRDAGVIARPRTMRVKSGSLPLVPTLAAAVAASPCIQNWDGTPIFSVDPSVAGRPWRIGEGRLDCLVFLEPNHGGRSVMGRLPKNEAFRRLMDEALVSPRGIGAGVARLRGLVAATATVRLQLGDLPGAARHLGRLDAWI